MVFVRITKADDGDKKSGVTIGSIFKATPYRLDPQEKFTLQKKISGNGCKYKPNTRNHYRSDLEIISKKERQTLGLDQQ